MPLRSAGQTNLPNQLMSIVRGCLASREAGAIVIAAIFVVDSPTEQQKQNTRSRGWTEKPPVF